ncbi:hypothetical protein CHRYSEOSP005_05850 [Chryseobacterium sp. Alg-005]|uniref:hypothetical protein n=1 Tax=Chryseobacterium sp. Alg-005 TaxID=3159516 RepID=UPI003555890A
MIKSRVIYALPLFFLAFLISCEDKKLQRPEHKIDLFADERHEGKAYVMSEEECYDQSQLVIATSDVKLADSSSGRGKAVFIYKVSSGELVKTTRDSAINYPLQFLSNYRLKLKKDSMYLYLQKLKGYRFIAKEKNLKYQWLKGASVYSVAKENK